MVGSAQLLWNVEKDLTRILSFLERSKSKMPARSYAHLLSNTEQLRGCPASSRLIPYPELWLT